MATNAFVSDSVAAVAERPRVDAHALTGACFHEFADALANTVSFTIDRCAESGYPLSERQASELMRSALLMSSDLEARIARHVIDDLERNGVEAWGWSF